MNKRAFGTKGEDAAEKFLKGNGYSILDRNYRAGRLGEIDIIAQKEEYICFIEVKTRTNIQYGMPSEAVGYKKQQTIRRISQHYLKSKSAMGSCMRFDIIEILNGEINHIVNAF